jgi:hypothetical protein
VAQPLIQLQLVEVVLVDQQILIALEHKEVHQYFQQLHQ